MHKYLRRLFYRTENKRHNFLMYPFLLMTASYGFALTFFQNTLPVKSSILYSLTVSSGLVPDVAVSVWGIVAVVVTVANIVGLLVRNKRLGTAVAMGGFMLWFFAFIVYALYGFWLQVLFAAIPNILFWGWYYVTVHKFHRQEDDLPY